MSDSNQAVPNRQANTGVMYVVATVLLFLLLSGVLAYAYPHFLPGQPEQAVRRFLVAHQYGTWDYVGYALMGPTGMREDYIHAAGRTELVGFETIEPYTTRMRWATGNFGETETVRVREHYATADGEGVTSVTVEYVLHGRGPEWFIDIDSIVSDGDFRQFLSRRGVAE